MIIPDINGRQSPWIFKDSIIVHSSLNYHKVFSQKHIFFTNKIIKKLQFILHVNTLLKSTFIFYNVFVTSDSRKISILTYRFLWKIKRTRCFKKIFFTKQDILQNLSTMESSFLIIQLNGNFSSAVIFPLLLKSSIKILQHMNISTGYFTH